MLKTTPFLQLVLITDLLRVGTLALWVHNPTSGPTLHQITATATPPGTRPVGRPARTATRRSASTRTYVPVAGATVSARAGGDHEDGLPGVAQHRAGAGVSY